MGCICHLMRGETCSHCNEMYRYLDRPDDIVDPIPGDILVMLTLDEGGASLNKERVLTLQQANARKIAAKDRQVAQELAHTYRPHSDPDGPPTFEFGNEHHASATRQRFAQEDKDEKRQFQTRKLPSLFHWTSLRDDLRMGASQLFPEEE